MIASLLARGAKNQDPQAMWLKDHYDRFVGLVFFVVGKTDLSRSEQEDVVQETFMRLWMQKERVAENSVKRWLVTTARNLAVDRLRSKDRQAAMSEREPNDTAEAWTAGEHSLQKERELVFLRQLVEEVAKETDGETFRLFYVEGWTAARIAEHYGEAVSTVTTRLSRLRKKFRERFRKRIEAFRAECARKGSETHD